MEYERNMQSQINSFHQEVEKLYPWNYWVSITDGAWFALGTGFISLYTILPLFVLNLTDSKILVSSVTTISVLGTYLPQIFIANYVEKVKSKKKLTAFFGFFQRIPWLGLSVFMLFLVDLSPVWLLTGFFFFFGMYSFAGGFCIPPWFDLTVKTIPSNHRGRYFGYRSFACGITELIGAALAGWILQALVFPKSFTILFGLTFVTTGISYLFLLQVKEPDYPIVKKHVGLWEYLGSLPRVLSEFKNFRLYIIAVIFLQFYIMGNALYTASALDRLGMTSAQQGMAVGTFTALMLIFQTISFPIWGHLSDRVGHRQIIALAGGLNFTAAVLAFFGNQLFLYCLVFSFAGLAQGANRISLMAIIPEFCSPENRPTFIGLTNSISGLSITLASFLGGVLADIYNYQTTFLLTGIVVFLGLVILLKYVEDPRKCSESAGIIH